MKTTIFTIVTITMLFSTAAPAISGDAFWNSYYAARGGYGGGNDIAGMLANQRNTEAIVNEMRAARGKPPCSIGLLGQWIHGRPAC